MAGAPSLLAVTMHRVPHMVVVLSPALELLAHVGERNEHFHVQALIAQLSVEGFNPDYRFLSELLI